LFENIAKQNEIDWNSHISLVVQLRLDDPRPITWDEYENMRLNSYEQQEIIPRFDNDAFIKYAQITLKNCSRIDTVCGREMPAHYDQAAVQLLRMALGRLRVSILEAQS
jgi:hypothetical protein